MAIPPLASTGIGSGLDVNAIVDKLMAIERRPLDVARAAAGRVQVEDFGLRRREERARRAADRRQGIDRERRVPRHERHDLGHHARDARGGIRRGRGLAFDRSDRTRAGAQARLVRLRDGGRHRRIRDVDVHVRDLVRRNVHRQCVGGYRNGDDRRRTVVAGRHSRCGECSEGRRHRDDRGRRQRGGQAPGVHVELRCGDEPQGRRHRRRRQSRWTPRDFRSSPTIRPARRAQAATFRKRSLRRTLR